MAKTDASAGARGISAFVVEKSDPGVSFGAPEKKLGIKGSPTREVYFDNVRVPADRMIGDPWHGEPRRDQLLGLFQGWRAADHLLPRDRDTLAVAVKSTAVVRPVRPWVQQPYYGAVFDGVTLGAVIAANAVPTSPSFDLCWYWSNSSKSRGYWDFCQ